MPLALRLSEGLDHTPFMRRQVPLVSFAGQLPRDPAKLEARPLIAKPEDDDLPRVDLFLSA